MEPARDYYHSHGGRRRAVPAFSGVLLIAKHSAILDNLIQIVVWSEI